MKQEHVIADELLKEAQTAFANNQYWIAYNTILYFLEKGDMYFFKDRDKAHEFSENNLSEFDDYMIIYARSADELLRQISYGEKITEQLSKINLSIMNEKNLNFLKDTLKYHGFGEKLFGELETKMKAVEKEFTLFVGTDMKKDKISATLHFRKSNDNENYFFNKYEAKLEKPGLEPREQTIYLDKGKGMTMKEAYNLLDGRAVHKDLTNQEGEKYKAWMQLNLETKDKNNNFEMNRYHQRYGYDVREALTYYAIKEFIKQDDSLNLVKSLERGNLHTVQIDRDGEKIQMQISADPKSRSLNIYEMDGRQLSKTEKEEMMLKPEIREQLIEQRNQLRDGKEKNNGQSKENTNGLEKSDEKTVAPGKEKGEQVIKAEEQGKEQSKSKSKEKDKSLLPKKEGNGLLEKKRTNSKKGMGIGG